jgi:hypothetical protein
VVSHPPYSSKLSLYYWGESILKGTASKNVSDNFFMNKVLELFDQISFLQYVCRGYNLYHSHTEVYSVNRYTCINVCLRYNPNRSPSSILFIVSSDFKYMIILLIHLSYNSAMTNG